MESTPGKSRGSSPENHQNSPSLLTNNNRFSDLEMSDDTGLGSPTPIRPRPIRLTSPFDSTFDSSSDPLNSTDFEPHFPIRPVHRLNLPNHLNPAQASNSTTNPASYLASKSGLVNTTNNLPQKRVFDPILSSSQPITKGPRFEVPISDNIRNTILEARDLIIKAYTLSQSRDEQSKLLDLVEVFREYTELGRIRHTSSILATQIANLEQTSRKIDNQAKNQPSQSTWANIAKLAKSAKPAISANSANLTDLNSTGPIIQNWTKVTNQKKDKAGTSPNTSSSFRNKIKENRKLALSKRCTLLQARNVQANEFSPIVIRDRLNTAFNSNGIKGLVVLAVSLSVKGNLVVTTTSEFNADFLVQNEPIIKGVLPLLRGLQKGEPWYKVAIHGIPIREFNTPEGMDLVVSEIKTFNKGLTPVGRPYWATLKETRDSGLVRTGTIIVAFPTEEQAVKAISNRLYIAGSSTKVVKYIATPSTAQCIKCAGFGHSNLLCKREVKCILCAENHSLNQHKCLICKNKSTKCIHLAPKCANCKSTSHSADSKLCDIYLAIKNKATSPTINE
jgi:hypothetical protein